MSHLQSFNTILLYCRDPKASAEFYRQLGFEISGPTSAMYQARLGAMAISLLDQAKAEFQQDVQREKGAGVFLMGRVDDVDAFHRELVDKGLKPSSQPRDWPWGNREFAIKDPDGYRLVFWQPKEQ